MAERNSWICKRHKYVNSRFLFFRKSLFNCFGFAFTAEAEGSGSEEFQVVSALSELISTELESRQLAEQDLSTEEVKPLLTQQHQPLKELEQASHTTKDAKVSSKIETAKSTQQLDIKSEVVITETKKAVEISSETFKSDETNKEKRVEINLVREDKQKEKESAVLETQSAKTTLQQANNSTQKETTEKFVAQAQTDIIEESSNSTEVVRNGVSVEKAPSLLTGVREVENFHVAVEVNVDVDDMSRKYSGLSSSRG